MIIVKNKTKVIKCSRIKTDRVKNIELGSEPVSEVYKFSYPGIKITRDNGCKEDITCGIAETSKSFTKKRYFLT